MEHAIPNRFYDHLLGAEKFSLIFPLSEDRNGLSWLESGKLIQSGDGEIETEDIEAVSLGGNRYRLAERCLGPFSNLRLHWGDEFFAVRTDGSTLTMTHLALPRPFTHFRYFSSGSLKNSKLIEEIVHEVGGGWETVAGGMLTLTVPVLRVQEFKLRMNATGLLRGVLRLVD